MSAPTDPPSLAPPGSAAADRVASGRDAARGGDGPASTRVGAPVVGIDLGTTHSLVAVYRDGRAEVLGDAMGARLMPSALAVDDEGALLVGSAAKARIGYAPTTGVDRFKRDMGTARTFHFAGKTMTPVEASSHVLRELAAIASARLGAPVQQAVVTVPAYFQEPQRAATRDAAELAGLEVVRIVNEPTAAAIAYGLRDAYDERNSVVIDLGGGTFDVTVLEVFEGVIEVSASTGDSRLGGEDFTDALVHDVARSLSIDLATLNPHAHAILRTSCERAKRQLSEADTIMMRLPEHRSAPWRANTVVPVQRSAFVALNAERLERIRSIIREGLIQAQRAPSDIDEVILVGGATRMPMIRELAEELFGRAPRASLDPDQVVAMGAAVQAAMVEAGGAVDDVIVTDVVPFSLGVRISREAHGVVMNDYYMPVLHRNATIPVSSTKRVSTTHPKQREVRVEVYQGEHRRVAENTLLGTFRVGDIPALEMSDEEIEANPRVGQAIDLTFTHDANGLLEVEATVVATGEKASIVIDQAPGRLSEEERAAALTAMAELKRHPREFLPNRHLLELARHRHDHYDVQRRELLDVELFRFEAALEARDARVIDESAKRLRSVLEYLGAP